MFVALRVVAVIGVLSYLSPVRQESGGPSLQDMLATAGDTLRGATSANPAQAEALWKSLPEPARKAALDRLFAAAGSAGPEAPRPAPKDTLQPEDLRPPWRGAKAREP